MCLFRATFLTVFLPDYPPILFCLLKDLSTTENFSLNASYCFVQNGFLRLAFPDDDDRPAIGLQLAPDVLVALLVP